MTVNQNLHVGDLDDASTSGSRNRWNASVIVTVHDDGNNLVSGATVSGTWISGANGGGSCATGSDGRCEITKSNLKANVSSASFTVTTVAASGYNYNPGENKDPDGDSNGTTITVKP